MISADDIVPFEQPAVVSAAAATAVATAAAAAHQSHPNSPSRTPPSTRMLRGSWVDSSGGNGGNGGSRGRALPRGVSLRHPRPGDSEGNGGESGYGNFSGGRGSGCDPGADQAGGRDGGGGISGENGSGSGGHGSVVVAPRLRGSASAGHRRRFSDSSYELAGHARGADTLVAGPLSPILSPGVPGMPGAHGTHGAMHTPKLFFPRAIKGEGGGGDSGGPPDSPATAAMALRTRHGGGGGGGAAAAARGADARVGVPSTAVLACARACAGIARAAARVQATVLWWAIGVAATLVVRARAGHWWRGGCGVASLSDFRLHCGAP
jgi:hypothetical protein